MPRHGGGRARSVGRRRPDADVERINEIANGLAAASMAMYANDDEVARQAVDETLEQASAFLSDAVARADARAQRRKVGAWATGVAAGAVAALAISLPPPGTTPQQTPLATDERPIDPFDRPADIRFPTHGPATTEGWLGDREATIPERATMTATLRGDAPTATEVPGGTRRSVEVGTSETGSPAAGGRAPEPEPQEAETRPDLTASSAALITGLLSSPQQGDQADAVPTAGTGPSEASATASEPSTTSEPMTTSEPLTASEPVATASLTARPAPDPSATTAHREAEPTQVASMDETEPQPATAASQQERTAATSSTAPKEPVGPPRRTATTPPPQAASQPGRSGTTSAQRADRPVVADQQVGRGRSGAAPGAGAKADSAPGRSGGVRADTGRQATEATAKNANERGARGRGH